MQCATLYICGAGRSGSTLLGEIFGSMPGVFFAGELQKISSPTLCQCRQPPDTCEFWTEVLRVLRRRLGDLAVDRFLENPMQHLRFRDVPGMICPPLASPDSRRGRESMSQMYAAFHKCIREVSRAQTLVDGSKSSSYLRGTLSDAARPVYLVHIVRDPRAVAFSWQRIKIEPLDNEGEGKTWPKQKPHQIATVWLAHHLLILRLLKAWHGELLRYEELMRRPQKTLHGVCERAQLPDASHLISENTVTLRSGHCLAGNTRRFEGCRRTLKLDDEWRTAMPFSDKLIVTALTFPFLKRLGY